MKYLSEGAKPRVHAEVLSEPSRKHQQKARPVLRIDSHRYARKLFRSRPAPSVLTVNRSRRALSRRWHLDWKLAETRRAFPPTYGSNPAPRPCCSFSSSHPFLPHRALHSLPLLSRFPACRSHECKAPHREVNPHFSFKNCRKVCCLFSFKQIFPSRNLSIIHLRPGKAHKSALPATLSFKPFIRVISSPTATLLPQQILKTRTSIFSLQKQSYSKKAPLRPMSWACDDVFFYSPSHQPHPAPFLPPHFISKPFASFSTRAAR